MQNNYSFGLEMQIPKENSYTGLTMKSNFDYEFEELSKKYNIHRINKVKEFIENNDELLNYINRITPIINSYFPKNSKCITFSEDYEIIELNNISIYINSSDETFEDDCKKFDELEVEIIKMNGFETKIKNLVSMDLWLL